LIALARSELAPVGAELAARGLLEAGDDVFFLDLREVRSALAGADHRSVVAARREGYARELRRRHVPRVLLSDGTEPEALATPGTAPDGALVGTPASAGTVTATARVVLDPVGAHLEPGEVLVAPSTDPGWTPLFLTAGALVMEMGGANSHGAVVAREYGIPAVVGVPGATSRITTGMRVTVDGASGVVRPEEG
jgi:phosphohistidine swiveling domain-containing protein